MIRLLLLVVLGLLLGVAAGYAQTAPTGQPVLNQAKQGSVLTLDQTFLATRGVYVGNPVPCAIMATFANTKVAVQITNLLPGAVYPFQIVRVDSGVNTTCDFSKIILLW